MNTREKAIKTLLNFASKHSYEAGRKEGIEKGKKKADKIWTDSKLKISYMDFKKEIPMGYSEWLEHGRKYSYLDFLKSTHPSLQSIHFETLSKKLENNWSLEKDHGKYYFTLWNGEGKDVFLSAKTPSALWAKINKLLKTI
jgi:hypothetical protein